MSSHNSIEARYIQCFSKDQALSQQAQGFFPDGITSDSRYMKPFALQVTHADGAYKWTASDRSILDYWAGHGALLFGHNDAGVVASVTEQIQRGTHFSACHPYLNEWAQCVIEMIPSAEQLRFTASGSEANLLALQLAQSYTGKQKVLRFWGHYHGWNDRLIYGSHIEDISNNNNISPSILGQTVLCENHDIDAVEHHLQSDNDIACIILEPTGAQSGVVPCDGVFLRQLRELTQAYGIVLIFDEVITGFRVSPGGAQMLYRVMPDLTTLGKVLAGGLPGGAVAGRTDIMQQLSFEQTNQTKIPHFGTFSGNALSAVAGIATLKKIKATEPYIELHRLATMLRDGCNDIIDQYQLDWVVYGEFSFIKFLVGHGSRKLLAKEFNPGQHQHAFLLQRGDTHQFQQLRLGMLLHGVDIALSSALTTAHSATDIRYTLDAFEKTIALMKYNKIIK